LKHVRVNELSAPMVDPGPFQDYFRKLIVDSLLQSAEFRVAWHRRQGHGVRARRAQRKVERLRVRLGLPVAGDAASVPHFGSELLLVTTWAWLLSCVLLVADIAFIGIDAWTTIVADLGTAALTLVWFAVSARQPPRSG
jgi:hypothetical protein